MIERRRRQFGVFKVFILGGVQMTSFFLITLEHVRIRVDDNQSGRAVHDDLIPGADKTRDIVQADNCRQLHGSGDNRRVRCPAAAIGGKPDDLVEFHLRRVRRRQVVRDDDDAVTADRPDNLALFAGQIAQNSLADVLHVADTPSNIGILNVFKDLLVMIQGHSHGPFGVDPHTLNIFYRPIDKLLVREDQNMDIDNIKRLGNFCLF